MSLVAQETKTTRSTLITSLRVREALRSDDGRVEHYSHLFSNVCGVVIDLSAALGHR